MLIKNFIRPDVPKRTAGVYKMSFDSGKFYIGSTICFKSRFSAWKSLLTNGIEKNEYITDEYDFSFKIVFEVIEIVDDPEMVKHVEDAYLKKFKGDPMLINKAESAFTNFGVRKSQASKERMREINKHRFVKVAKVSPDGTVVKIYNTVAEVTTENKFDRRKLSDACRKNHKIFGFYYRKFDSDGVMIEPPKKEKKPRPIGVKRSEETKKKMSEAQRRARANGHYSPQKHAKEIFKIDGSGNIVAKYQSVREAAVANNVDRSSLKRIINRRRGSKGTYKGFYYTSIANNKEIQPA